MPFFKCVGITIEGKCIRKSIRTRSIEQLEEELLLQDLGLVRAQMINRVSWLRPINLSMQHSFFSKLAILLDAGLFLHQALAVVCKTVRHRAFKEIIEDMEIEVAHGLSFASICEQYPAIFDSTICMLLHAGQQSGNIAGACTMLANHFHQMNAITRKVVSALALPAITLSFFLCVVLVILVVIVPMFATLFSSFGKPLPTSTAWLVYISSWVSVSTGIAFILLCIIAYCAYQLLKRFERVNIFFNTIFFHIPVIGPIMHAIYMVQGMQSLSLLLKHNVPLFTALQIQSESIKNKKIAHEFSLIKAHIEKGETLYDAIKTVSWKLSDEAYSLLNIGHESGTLAKMIQQVALIMQEELMRRLNRITVILQPMLMIILGLLVVAMIVLVYIPIFNISYTVV